MARTRAAAHAAMGETIESPRMALQLASQASGFWTVSEMTNSEPYPMPTVHAEEQLEIAYGLLAAEEEGGQIVPGHLPEHMHVLGKEGTESTVAGGYDYPAPFNRLAVPPTWYETYPYITVGKVFFKQNGNSYVGSAASIGNYAIWTAGHIVHAGNNKETGWSTDMIFVPAYHDGEAPFGKWPVAYMRTRTEWYKQGNPGGLWDDMAGGILYPLNGQKISQRVGALGFAHNLPRLQHWHAAGYPQAPPFDGKLLIGTHASYAYDGGVTGSVKPVAIGCDMTGGCSGGPWIFGFGSRNLLNGNNSYRQDTRPLEMNSPYFDDRAKTLYNELIGLTPS